MLLGRCNILSTYIYYRHTPRIVFRMVSSEQHIRFAIYLYEVGLDEYKNIYKYITRFVKASRLSYSSHELSVAQKMECVDSRERCSRGIATKELRILILSIFHGSYDDATSTRSMRLYSYMVRFVMFVLFCRRIRFGKMLIEYVSVNTRNSSECT